MTLTRTCYRLGGRKGKVWGCYFSQQMEKRAYGKQKSNTEKAAENRNEMASDRGYS